MASCTVDGPSGGGGLESRASDLGEVWRSRTRRFPLSILFIGHLFLEEKKLGAGRRSSSTKKFTGYLRDEIFWCSKILLLSHVLNL